LPATQEALDVTITTGNRQYFSVLVSNSADEEFVVVGVAAEHDGTALGAINRPSEGTIWHVPAKGRLQIPWPANTSVIGSLVSIVGKFQGQCDTFIDFVFHCSLRGKHREFRKRVRVQVDTMNNYIIGTG